MDCTDGPHLQNDEIQYTHAQIVEEIAFEEEAELERKSTEKKEFHVEITEIEDGSEENETGIKVEKTQSLSPEQVQEPIVEEPEDGDEEEGPSEHQYELETTNASTHGSDVANDLDPVTKLPPSDVNFTQFNDKDDEDHDPTIPSTRLVCLTTKIEEWPHERGEENLYPSAKAVHFDEGPTPEQIGHFHEGPLQAGYLDRLGQFFPLAPGKEAPSWSWAGCLDADGQFHDTSQGFGGQILRQYAAGLQEQDTILSPMAYVEDQLETEGWVENHKGEEKIWMDEVPEMNLSYNDLHKEGKPKVSGADFQNYVDVQDELSYCVGSLDVQVTKNSIRNFYQIVDIGMDSAAIARTEQRRFFMRNQHTVNPDESVLG